MSTFTDMRAANELYKTQAWQKCREAYASSVNYLCERCLEEGIIEAGEIVHHKIHLTTENKNDPSVVFNFENLEMLCRKHHAEAHPEVYKSKRRYKVDKLGRVIAKA